MQSSQMIFLPCRRQLLVVLLHRAQAQVPRSQWQARPSVQPAYSTTPTPPVPDSHSTDDFIPLIDYDDPDILAPWRTGEHAPNAVDPRGPGADGRFKTMPKRRTPYMMKQRHLTNRNNQDDSMKLFEQVVAQQGTQAREAEGDAQLRDLSPEAVDYYTKLANLRPMMKERPIEECLDFFLTHIRNKALWEGRGNRLGFQRGRYLMVKVAQAKMEDIHNQRLPSVAQITQHFYDLECLSPQKWTEMMMGLVKAIVGKSSDRQRYANDSDYEMAMARKEELLNDLVDSWIMFHRYKMSADDSKLQTSAEAEFRLPDFDTAELEKYASMQNPKAALSCIFPSWVAQIRQIPAVAIATFVLLVDPAHSNTEIRQKAKPLLVPIGHVVSACPVPQSTLADMLEPYPSVLLYVLGQWEALIRRLHGLQPIDGEHEQVAEEWKAMKHEREREKIVHPKEESDEAERLVQASVVVGDKMAGTIRARINNALGMGDVVSLESVWRSWWGEHRLSDLNRLSLRKHPKVFDHFIMAFTALSKPKRAVDVWDLMTRVADLPPTIKTWLAMMEGCRKSKNASGIENVWRKMVVWAKQMNQSLDHIIWSSRIVGLMDSGEPDAALRALNEMAKLSKVAGGVKVNIDVVNAAVGGLIRLNATTAASKILSWASQLYDGADKIEPNIVTYNTLLGPMIRQGGQTAQIKATLQMMTANGVKPDVATYTLFLEGLINEDLDPANQKAGVKKLISNMEEQGIVPNMETFGHLLHIALRHGSHTATHRQGAAEAIFEYAKKHHLGISKHIYTLLVQHYFACSPPAIDAVNRLLAQQAQHDRDRWRLDRVFWERVIKGFALAGVPDQALMWFDRVNNLGTALTLDTLEVLVRSLVRLQKNREAADVVAAIKVHRSASMGGAVRRSGPDRGRGEVVGRYWRHGFWAFAIENNLISPAEWRRLREGGFVQDDAVPQPTAPEPAAPQPTATGA